MFELKREVLFAELLAQASKGSVLVTGAPGIGKSWLIGRLLGHLKNNGRFVLPLIAEDFEVSTPNDLQLALKLTQPVDALLAKQEGGVLLIDGLDALRAESSQRVFRDLILDVLRNAPRVTIVATIRSYDLAESPLFSNLSSYIPGLGKPFSTLVVGPLTFEEIDYVRRERSNFDVLWNVASVDTRELLRTPFNLVIALALMKEGISAANLSGIGSQAALLDAFWKLRVENVPGSLERKNVLKQILDKMVQSKSLSIAEVEISSLESLSAFRDVFSVELLRRSATGRIFFSHNILFDYALARLCLDEVRLASFISEDANRSLYYRPSLNFFFGHVWLADRSLFWKIATGVRTLGILPESIEVIPAVVVCQMAETFIDLQPLVDTSLPAANEFLRKVLVGIQALGVPTDRRRTWIEFLSTLCDSPNLEFINELLSVLSTFKDGMRSEDRLSLNKSARQLIQWSWSFNEDAPIERRAELTAVVTGRLLPIVLQTLRSDPDTNRAFVRQLLKRIGTPGSSSRELFWVTNDIVLIIDFDPELAAEIYEAVYSYKEKSEKRVSIGSGTVMNLLTTERQDYEGLLYGLIARSKALIDKNFLIAARTAVRIVNFEVARERPLNEREKLHTFKMRVAGHILSYTADYSEIWDSGAGRDYTSLQMFGGVLRAAQERTNAADAVVLADIVLSEGSAAILFKKLLEAAASSVELFVDGVGPCLTSARFISAPEVTVAVGSFLKRLAERDELGPSFWSSIESTVLKIPNSRPILRYERPRSIQARLLSCMRDRLTDSRSFAILSSVEKPRPNEPFFQIRGGAVAPHSAENYRHRGIDPENPTNKALIDATDTAREFAFNSPNSAPSINDAENALPALLKLRETLTTSGDGSVELLATAKGMLYAAVATMSRIKDMPDDSQLFKFVLSEALEGAVDSDPVFNPKYHLPFDSPGWGGPSSRIEAAQAIVNLVWNYKSENRTLAAFRSLMNDAVPAVRFQIARGLVALYVRDELRGEFWESIHSMLLNEKTTGVTMGLLQSLGQVAGREPTNAISVLADYLSETYQPSEHSDAMRQIIGILVGLYIAQGTPSARAELKRFESDLPKYHRELSQMVLAAGQQITPADGSEIERARAREVWESVLAAVISCSADLQRQPPPRNFEGIISVLDTLISRLYFSFDLIGTRAPGQNALDGPQRRILFEELQPFIKQLVQADEIESAHDIPLIPHTAHYFLQLMNGILEYSPEDVLGYAYAVCQRGARTGYLHDSLARTEAVNLVERAIAEFRDRLKQPEVATAVSGMLNLFTKYGWPEAVTLTFKLDDAFR